MGGYTIEDLLKAYIDCGNCSECLCKKIKNSDGFNCCEVLNEVLKDFEDKMQ